ncbi:MAG: corrinoid protein [Coriobacteriia bacterium]|nr:corrinoid protein [Coriobacteriia bacterium]
MTILIELSQAVQAGNRGGVEELTNKALAQGMDAKTILDEGLISAMTIIGDKFSRNEIFVPEMLVAARAMNVGTELLKPHLIESGAEPLGQAVIGTIEGDMHDIGKNLVRMMIEGKGIDIVDLGVNVSPSAFVEHLKENPSCTLVCLSALLTTTLPKIPETIESITAAGLRNQVKIMIGGAPVTQEFANQVGADAYTPDAGSASIKAAELIAS